VRCAHALLKAGFGALRPYILVSLDIVLGFGISGQPLCSECMFGHFGIVEAKSYCVVFLLKQNASSTLRACEQYRHYSLQRKALPPYIQGDRHWFVLGCAVFA